MKMIDQELIKRNFVGRDGFVWWIGQVASEEKWNPNIPGRRVFTPDEIKGFGDRYKVRILGYHTDNPIELTDDDLPWVPVMLPVTAGGGTAGSSQSSQIRQGNFVFGFFLDGEDAQQPIIIGVLGYNNYTAVTQGVPQVKYVAFEGFKGIDTIPQASIREAPGPGSKSAAADSVALADSKSPKTSDGVIISGSPVHQLKSVAEKVQLEEGNKVSPIIQTDPCGSSLDAALLDLQEGIKEIQRIKASVNNWAAAAVGKIADQQERIQRITSRLIENITKPLKDKFDEIRKWVITEIEDKAKDAYYFLFPEERNLLKVAQSEVTEIISCLFNKIIKGLLELVARTVLSFIDKVINVGNCIANNVIGGLIGQVGGLVNGLISLALGPMNAILGAVNAALDLGQAILGLLFDVLGFFRCEENPKCPGYKEWSVWNGTTINEINKIGTSITSVLQKAESVKQSTVSAISAAGGVFGSVDQALSSFDPVGFVQSALLQCASEIIPVPCGPPSVSIFGGGGTGAAGNPIIGRNGEVLGVDIVSKGLGYVTEPFVAVGDPCGKGQGSVVRAKLKKRDKKSAYAVSVGGTTGVSYGTNVGNVNSYGINEDPREPRDREDDSYGIVSGEWTNVGIVTSTTSPFVPFVPNPDDPERPPKPILRLEVSPPGGLITAGDPITIRYTTQYATRIVYSNFGATRLGNSVGRRELEREIEAYDRPRVGEVTFDEISTAKTFILTVANDLDTVTSVLRVDIRQLGEDGEIVDNEIDDFIVEDPGSGYLTKPDGSLGGMNRVWSENNQTIVRRGDGTYDTPYNPGDNINLERGDVIRTPSNTSFIDPNGDIIFIPGNIDYIIGSEDDLSDLNVNGLDENGNVLEENLDANVTYSVSMRAPDVINPNNLNNNNLNNFNSNNIGNSGLINNGDGSLSNISNDILNNLNKNNSTGRALNEFNQRVLSQNNNFSNITPQNILTNNQNSVFGASLEGNSYGVVLELYDVEILNGGVNYSSEDEFVIAPENFGVVLKPVLGAFGTIVDVEVISTGKGFTTYPNIYINSQTGFNAKFAPRFRVNRVGDIKELSELGVDVDNVLAVVDCVGRVS